MIILQGKPREFLEKASPKDTTAVLMRFDSNEIGLLSWQKRNSGRSVTDGSSAPVHRSTDHPTARRSRLAEAEVGKGAAFYFILGDTRHRRVLPILT